MLYLIFNLVKIYFIFYIEFFKYFIISTTTLYLIPSFSNFFFNFDKPSLINTPSLKSIY